MYLSTLSALAQRPKCVVSSCALSDRSSFNAAVRQGAGYIEFHNNTNAMSKSDPKVKTIKNAFDGAVRDVLGPDATVMLAGSARKGTATANSDIDLYARITTGVIITRRQRQDIADKAMSMLHSMGLDYQQVGSRNVLQFQSHTAGYPDVDLAFDNFNSEERKPPAPCPLPGKQALWHQTIRYLKNLSVTHTLNEVPGSSLERFVAEVIVRCKDYDECCSKVLQVIKSGQIPGYAGKMLPRGGLANEAWRNAATSQLKQRPIR